MNYTIMLFLCFALTFTFSCTTTEQHDHDHDHGSEMDDHHDDHPEGEIHLTDTQLKTMNIKTGEFSKIKVHDFVEATGMLGLPPNAVTKVTPPIAGFLKNTRKLVEGAYIKKGTVIGTLENPDFIDWQQEYWETQAALTFAQQEMKRQETLFADKAGIEKNVQDLTAQVNQLRARQKGIAQRLRYVGISIDNLSPEDIRQSVTITAPMSGYLTSVHLFNGSYVQPQDELLEIINDQHLHLELDVFEGDISKIKTDQKISYTVPALGGQLYRGEVHVIGKEFDHANKTVRVHGHLEKERPRFIKDLFINAKIWLNDEQSTALPEKAVIKKGPIHVVYYDTGERHGDERVFKALQVVPKQTEDGFTAIDFIDPLPANAKIVTEGAYFVYSQSIVEELEHSH